MKGRRLAVIGRRCVACGCCENTCPMGAVKVARGGDGSGECGKMRGLRKMRAGLSGGDY